MSNGARETDKENRERERDVVRKYTACVSEVYIYAPMQVMVQKV